jgi:8-oxo-dGTP pyrophosphatase MutT (NUDIX family)
MPIQNYNVGIKAAIIRDDKLLLLKDAKGNFWDLPGGRMDDDETTMQTLARELSEELPGVEVHKVGGIITAYRVPGVEFENGSGLLLIVYRVDAEFDGENILLSDEHTESKWVTFDEALTLDSHVARETVNALQQA